MESKDIRSIQEAYALICETASPQRTPSGSTVSQKPQRDPNTRATAPTSAADQLKSQNKKNFPAPKPLEERMQGAPIPAPKPDGRNLPPTRTGPTPMPPRTPKPTPGTRKNLPNLGGVIKSSADLFDIVGGYLIDEGFAETEEAAIAIMANMSEEWRDSILEFWGPKTVNLKPGQSPSGTKQVEVGKPYPAKLNGQPVMKTYGAQGGSSTRPMTTGEKIRTFRQHTTAY